MLRIISIGLGGFLIALGIVWFFSSTLDSIAMSSAGISVTPLSKMTFSDSLSVFVAGLTATGFLLLAYGVFSAVSTSSKPDNAKSKPA